MARRWRSPTLTTLAAMGVVFAVQLLVGALGLAAAVGPFALSAPLAVAPYTLILSVYAHAGAGHLLANGLALAVVGPVIERTTTALRFHAFFVATGAVAGATEVLVAGLAGPLFPWIQPGVTVMGASGAIFGLVGYLIAANRLTDRIAGWLDAPAWAGLVAVLVLAGSITWLTAGTRVAIVAHFTGLVIGLVAGRTHLLAP